MKYYKIALDCLDEDKQRITEIAFEMFDCLGTEEYSLEEGQVDQILAEDSFCGSQLSEQLVNKIEDHCKAERLSLQLYFDDRILSQEDDFYLELKKFKLQTRPRLELLPNMDWNEEWKKHYKPILVSPKLMIVPSFLRGEENGELAKSLYIEPGMGFGTGDHETTFMCLEVLCECEPGSFDTVLDFGCGSGILGLAALLLGGKRVYFYDIDDDALENLGYNLNLNSAIDSSQIFIHGRNQKKLLPGNCDLVFANILQNVLEDERDFLIDQLRPNSLIILSGLLKDQRDELLEKYLERNQLELVGERSLGDWVCLCFRRNSLES